MAVRLRWANSRNSFTRLSLLMSSFQPVSCAARRTFCPRRPMASESWSSGTMISIALFCSSSSTRVTSAGCSAFTTKRAGSSSQGTMSIFSPRSSCTTACTRLPFMPTQAPTGSTSPSREATAILVRPPGSRATASITTTPSAISGTSISNSLRTSSEEAQHDAADDLALAVLVVVVDVLALRIAGALDDHLLGGLRGDAPERLAVRLEVQDVPVPLVLDARLLLILGPVEDLEEQLVADLGLDALLARVVQRDLVHRLDGVLDLDARHHRQRLEDLHHALLLVVGRLDGAVGAEVLLGRLGDGVLQGVHQDVAIDAFVLRHLVQDHVQVERRDDLRLRGCHGSAPCGFQPRPPCGRAVFLVSLFSSCQWMKEGRWPVRK